MKPPNTNDSKYIIISYIIYKGLNSLPESFDKLMSPEMNRNGKLSRFVNKSLKDSAFEIENDDNTPDKNNSNRNNAKRNTLLMAE